MRVLAIPALVALLSVLQAGCGQPMCATPPGCLVAQRVGAACGCAQWETVATEKVAVPYLLAGVDHEPVGTATVYRYGYASLPAPAIASSAGTSVRFVVREPGGQEQVARIGALPDAYGSVEKASETVARIFRGGGLRTRSAGVDLPTADWTFLTVWANPEVTVATDSAGGRTVHLGLAPGRCFQPMFCANRMAEGLAIGPRALRGEVSWGASHDAFVASLSDADRAALLAFVPGTTGTLPALPRFQWIDSVRLDERQVNEVDATWTPCTDPSSFTVLAEAQFPMQGAAVLALQYGVQGSGQCAPQRPGVEVGTATPGCAIDAQVLVDRLTGSVLLQPTSATDACTR